MGLFNSPKFPQPPLPNMTINLSATADKVFRPDDIITGHIAFTPVVPIAPHAIEVSLNGQSLVWYRTRYKSNNDKTYYHHWRDNAPLFEVVKSVLPALDSKSPPLQVGQTYTYPFFFRFPAGTGNSRTGQYKQDDDEMWTTRPHDLPPSFLHTDKYGTGEHANYAKIEYGVRARLLCLGVGVVKGNVLHDLVVTVPVLFVPLNSNPYTPRDPLRMLKYPKILILQSSALTGQDSVSIGFRQSLRDRFSCSTPKIEFEISLLLPDILTSGSEFQFGSSFNVLSKTGDVSKIPAVHFKILKLSLKDITFVRAPRDIVASRLSDGSHGKNEYIDMPPPNAPFSGQERIYDCERKTLLNSLSDSVTLELEEVVGAEKKVTEQASSCEAWFTARVPGFTPPSFKSFAISREYHLKVKLGVGIGGKWFEHELECSVREMGSVPVLVS